MPFPGLLHGPGGRPGRLRPGELLHRRGASQGFGGHHGPHRGETYRFISAANRDAFAADPEKYLPQYGGYCAWAVAQGKLAPGDPLVSRVVDGKLYLNVNRSIAARWQQDIPGFIRSADANWPKLK